MGGELIDCRNEIVHTTLKYIEAGQVGRSAFREIETSMASHHTSYMAVKKVEETLQEFRREWRCRQFDRLPNVLSFHCLALALRA